MSCRSLTDHIMMFPEALTPEHCRALIARFESAPEHAISRLDAGYSFSQLDITGQWPDENKLLVPIFLSHFNRYQLALDARFWPVKFSFEHVRIKRYMPNGRDQFPLHVDVVNQAACRRFMTALIYLNAPGGGETVFPTLDISVAPEPGKLLAFPPLWMFPHEGLAPRSAAKYILHTYLCYPATPAP